MNGRAWTKGEIMVLKKLYPGMATAKIARRMGRSVAAVNGRATILGLKKDPGYLNSPQCGRMQKGTQLGYGYQFKPGHVPHNKGRKGWQAGGDAVKTQFKKGRRPHTWVPIGSTRLSKEGILQRKVTDTGYGPRDWKSVHGLLWEQHFGPIPKGHIVVFKDGNRKKIRIDNLELISRAENMRRNTIHTMPAALADAIRTLGALNRRIRKKEKRDEK